MLNDILTFVVCALVAYVVCKWVLYIWHQNMRRQLQHYEGVIERLNEIIHEVRIEKHGDDMYYWFDAHSDEFLAQGHTLTEITTVVKSRFPDHIFLVPGLGGMGAGTDWRLVDDTKLQAAMLAAKSWRRKPLEGDQ